MSHKQIKIVHIVEGFVGGLSTYVCTVLPQLVQNGFDTTLICSLKRRRPDAYKLISELRRSGVKVYVVPMCRRISPLRDIYSFAIILRLLLRNQFDIVHTHCSKAGVLGRIAAALAGTRIRLHSSHCFVFLRCQNRLMKLLYRFIEQLLAMLTTMFVAVSQSDADAAIGSNIATREKCVVVENGLSNNLLPLNAAVAAKYKINKAALGIAEDTQVVTTACRLVKYKGIFRFLEAAKICHSHKTVFLIAGDGKLKRSVERFIRENSLGNKVRLLGHCSDMEQIYAISDIVALCSDAEAQPYLLLEAIRARCAVVATSVPGNRELITEGRGILVDPKPASIVLAIEKLLADPNERNRCAENAYVHFCRHHTLENQVAKLTQVYESCISNAGHQYATDEFTAE